MHFTGSKLSLLLAGRCVLGCWAVGCSRACDVWGGGVRDEGRQSGVGQGAWVVKTGRCGCLRWVERLVAGVAAVAVNAVALIWELARTGFLTLRGLFAVRPI